MLEIVVVAMLLACWLVLIGGAVVAPLLPPARAGGETELLPFPPRLPAPRRGPGDGTRAA